MDAGLDRSTEICFFVEGAAFKARKSMLRVGEEEARKKGPTSQKPAHKLQQKK